MSASIKQGSFPCSRMVSHSKRSRFTRNVENYVFKNRHFIRGQGSGKKRKRILRAAREGGWVSCFSPLRRLCLPHQKRWRREGGDRGGAAAAGPPSLRLVFQELELSAQCSVSDLRCLAELVFQDLQSALPGGRSSVSDFPLGATVVHLQ